MKHCISLIIVLACLHFPSGAQVFSIPYMDDFESGAPGWHAHTDSMNQASQWELGMPGFGQTNSTHSGSGSWDVNLNTSYQNQANCYLVSPPFNFGTHSSIRISFWHNYNAEIYWDGHVLQYTTDTISNQWTVIGSVNAPLSNNWYTWSSINSSNLPAWTGGSSGWTYSSIVIPNPSPDTMTNVWFRFRFSSDNSVVFDGASIDDFSIEPMDMNVFSGSVYLDMNSDYLIDAGDSLLPGVPINATPSGNGYLVTTDANGAYSFLLNAGITTTFTPTPPTYSVVTPVDYTITFSGSNQVNSGNDFLITFLPGIIDPSVQIFSSPVRPGFQHVKTIQYSNPGTTPVSGSIAYTYDTSFALVSTSEPYTVAGPNTIEFNYNLLLPGESRNITCNFLTDTSLVVGSNTVTSVIIYPLSGDTNIVNNYDTLYNTVINSYDPNNKLVDPEGDLDVSQVASGMDIHYTINFQNTGNAPAIHVNVFDMIDSDLDLSTFEVTAFSHPLTSWNIGANRQAQFTFANINLPDSVNNEPASHGFISYTIRPYTNLASGTQIDNTAAIVFDFNAPVITNTVTSTVVQPSGIATPGVRPGVILYPNPNSGAFHVRIPDACYQYSIYNSIGQQIVTPVRVSGGTNVFISLDDPVPGIYLVRLEGKEVLEYAKLIIH